MRNSVLERYRMARKSDTISHKARDDTSFDPIEETKKILKFSDEAGRSGFETFTVIVKAGILEWTGKKVRKDHPGFIATFNNRELAGGATLKQWRRLEEKIAIEMSKQRKAW